MFLVNPFLSTYNINVQIKFIRYSAFRAWASRDSTTENLNRVIKCLKSIQRLRIPTYTDPTGVYGPTSSPEKQPSKISVEFLK